MTTWPNKDEAFLDVVQQIRNALPNPSEKMPAEAAFNIAPMAPAPSQPLPRSSNLRLKKEFSDADKDRFLDEALEFMTLFFQNSLSELQERNAGIETRFKRLDAEAFSAIIYKHGNVAAKCGIRRAGRRGFGDGITFSYDENAPRNAFNESLSVVAGDQSLFLRPMGMFASQGPEQLSPEGAAELFWAKLIERLQ